MEHTDTKKKKKKKKKNTVSNIETWTSGNTNDIHPTEMYQGITDEVTSHSYVADEKLSACPASQHKALVDYT